MTARTAGCGGEPAPVPAPPAPLLAIASHGALARAALDSARQIFGPLDPAQAFGLDVNGRLEDLEREILAAWKSHGADRPLLLLVDLFGGSCSNVAARILKKLAAATPGQAPAVRVIAGFNLAMLIEFAFSRDKYPLDALADRLIEAGRKACLDVNGKLRGGR